MRGEIKIGSENVEMLCNAASPIFYKRIFHEDFLIQMQDLQKSMTEEDGSITLHGNTDIFSQMGFVMAEQAKQGDDKLLSLSFSDFVKWVSAFSPMDMVNAIPDITNLYMAQEKTSADAKKKDE